MRPIAAGRAVGLALTLLFGVRAAESAAQEAELQISAGRVMDERGDVHGGLALAPGLTWSPGPSAVGVAAQGTWFDGGKVLGTGGAWARTVFGIRGRVAAVMDGEGWLTASSGGYRAVTGAFRPRLQVTSSGWGMEAGPHLTLLHEEIVEPSGFYAPGRTLFGDDRTSREDGQIRSERALGVGGWLARGPVTLRAGWRTTSLATSSWQDWTGEGVLSLGRGLIGVRAGARTGGPREEWMAGRAEGRLGRRAAVAVEAGRNPSAPLTRRRGGSYASIGLRLSGGTGRGGEVPRPLPVRTAGMTRIVLNAPPGARVELLADWNGWRPEAVVEAEPGRYAVSPRLEPGVYRFAFRVNGKWRTPDGFEVEPDEFGGERALLRVSAAS